ncbi:aldolase [Macrolepiota fuliginosa MF-IS2]|uniref:Aldolase n=1 Tax=Macrolepiota fuliginosa MF-IS2 TaxID=1400762 RepID=A0A9P6C0I5_9AGAR|nr:aldolase [Macrolepiota fuliginosa MF-IS2]
MTKSLLQQVRSLVVVDVDSMDPNVSKRHTTAGERFQDMTSNQGIALGEIVRPENADLVKAAILHVQEQNLDQDPETFRADIIDTLTVLLGKRVFPYLNGSVHAQTSPSVAYDTEKTIAHAKRLVALFGEHGTPKERVCIKIPATPESLLACQYLQKIGIQTLATCLFSLPQALAASQAGCKYVAPYFNELRVHSDKSIWKEYANPALEHPMSSIILSIVAAFRELKSRTLVVALVSLQPDHITISGQILDQLALLPETKEIQLVPFSLTDDITSLLGKNYLANRGSLLRDAINGDVEVQRKLADALAIFDDCEKKTRDFLDTIL